MITIGTPDADTTNRLMGTVWRTGAAGTCYTLDDPNEDGQDQREDTVAGPVELPIGPGYEVEIARVLVDAAGTRRALCRLADSTWWTLQPLDTLKGAADG